MAFENSDFSVFVRYADATDHAFSNRLVSETDRNSYQDIYKSLGDVIESCIEQHSNGHELEVRRSRFSKTGGVQGQRPLDLWASIINKNSEDFLRFPQVYAIASEQGIEVGFTIWIHEGDYYNSAVKKAARTINPILVGKIPAPSSPMLLSINQELSSRMDWIFAVKSRKQTFQQFSNSAIFRKSYNFSKLHLLHQEVEVRCIE